MLDELDCQVAAALVEEAANISGVDRLGVRRGYDGGISHRPVLRKMRARRRSGGLHTASAPLHYACQSRVANGRQVRRPMAAASASRIAPSSAVEPSLTGSAVLGGSEAPTSWPRMAPPGSPRCGG